MLDGWIGQVRPDVSGLSQYAQGRSITWTFQTPVTGATSYELPVPLDAEGNAATWTLNKVWMRTSVPSAGSTSMQLQYSTVAGAFSGTNMLTSTLTLSGTGVYEVSTTAFDVDEIDSGDKLRVTFSAADETHAGVVVTVEIGLVVT